MESILTLTVEMEMIRITVVEMIEITVVEMEMIMLAMMMITMVTISMVTINLTAATVVTKLKSTTTLKTVKVQRDFNQIRNCPVQVD